MNVKYFTLEGPVLFESVVFRDDRGYFQEIYHYEKFKIHLPRGLLFVQDNMSYSKHGTIRGIHFQKEPYAQAKLIRCVLGSILDVVVDIRKGSPTYGKHISLELSGINHLQLFIPKGFAHGFSVLSKKAIVEYKCDEYYHPESDAGIRFNDPTLNIDWKIPQGKILVSEKDANLPYMSDLVL